MENEREIELEMTEEVVTEVETPKQNLKVNTTLEDKVRLTVSLIGIGNAGNQIVANAHKEGFRVFAINSSIRDLADEVVNEHIHSFIAGGEGRGAGKDREVAKALFKINGKELFADTYFTGMVEDSDIVVVCGSTAGGTGSGIAPGVITLLTRMYPSKIILYYGVLPKTTDSPVSQKNTLDCMDEISKLNIPYGLADLAVYDEESNDIAYSEVSKHIVESLKIISGSGLNHSKAGMIDENDMKAIVGEPGYFATYSLSKITQKMVDSKSIQSYMIQKIKTSAAAELNRDSIIKQMGVIVNMPEEMSEASKTGNYNELYGYIGTPLSVFENYATNNNTLGEFSIILSGMNLPYSRMLRCKESITKVKEKLNRQKEIDLSRDTSELSFIGKSASASRMLNNISESKEAQKDALDEFFG